MGKHKSLIGVICAVVCQFIFGFSLLFTRTATYLASPMTLLSWRFIIAFIVFNLCVLMGIIKVNLKGKPLLPLILIAIFYPLLYFIGETIGISLTSASESGTMIATIPIATLLFSSIILRITPAKFQIVGICTTVLGVVVIVIVQGLDAAFNPIGYTMLLLAVVSYALYAIFAQKAEMFTSAEKSYIMTALGAFSFTTVALMENLIHGTLATFVALPFANMDFLVSVLYLGIGSSVGAFLLYNTAIANIGATRAVSFAGISTIVAVISGVIILQERFAFFQGVGVVLVIVGVYLANAMPKRRTP